MTGQRGQTPLSSHDPTTKSRIELPDELLGGGEPHAESP